jgi:uncharacterized membrane protein YkvA (DUF1232 family)
MEESPEDKRSLTEEEIGKLRKLLTERAQRIDEQDLRALLAKEEGAEKKLSTLADALPRMVSQVRLGFSLIKDYFQGNYRKLPWWSVASVAAGLGYFLTPTDLIPDFLPVIGYIDDAAVLALVMAGIREDLKKYAEAKGIPLE